MGSAVPAADGHKPANQGCDPRFAGSIFASFTGFTIVRKISEQCAPEQLVTMSISVPCRCAAPPVEGLAAPRGGLARRHAPGR